MKKNRITNETRQLKLFKEKQMKYLLVIISVLVLSSCAYTPDRWTKEQVMLQGVSSTLNIIDWGQTLDIVDKPDTYCEINPIVGKHPSRAEVNRYCACALIGKILVTYLLPSKYRKYWLGSNILISGYLVQNNYRIGLRINY